MAEDSAQNITRWAMIGDAARIQPGEKFWQLTANYIVPGYKRLWDRTCDCGGSINVIESKLRLGQRRTCHLIKTKPRVDYTGKKFNFLTGISCIKRTEQGRIWSFLCDCGRTIETQCRNVARGYTKSCGCKTKELKGRARRLSEEGAVRNNAYVHHIAGAKKRGLVSNLSQSYYISLTKKPCHYCGGTSNRAHYRTRKLIPCNSVDRLNNEMYYTTENSVPCCFDCQTAKMCLSEKAFLELVARIFLYRNLGAA